MGETKIQWHLGFVAAMNLELAENRNELEFEKEYNLNTKPLEIDLLVIRKEAEVRIANEIGRIFRGHNIMEYKSPEDRLDIDTFYKVSSYAGLYKAYGKTVDERKAEDITISLLREGKPEGLFRYFEEHGYTISSPYRGIYYVEGKVLFPTQIVVTGELEKETHVWLGALSEKLEKQELKRLFESIGTLQGKEEQELADSVLEVSIEANRKTMEELIGDGSMYDALMELMEPRLKQRDKVVEELAMQKGRIQGAVEMLRKLEYEDEEITESIMKEYNLTEQEMREYL